MKSTAVCIKDAAQNKSFLVNTGLYVYVYHSNLSSRIKVIILHAEIYVLPIHFQLC